MLAIYFAISDNLKTFKKMKRTRQLIIVRSDSKSTIEQLNNRTVIKDKIIQRIYTCIKRMLERISYTIVFDHLYRAENTAGKILERIIRTYSNRYRIDTFYNNKINKDVFTKNIDTISIKQCPLIE